jgi:hypothetical protein
VGAVDKRERPARERDVRQVEPRFVAGKEDVAMKLRLRVVLPGVLALREMPDLGE